MANDKSTTMYQLASYLQVSQTSFSQRHVVVPQWSAFCRNKRRPRYVNLACKHITA